MRKSIVLSILVTSFIFTSCSNDNNDAVSTEELSEAEIVAKLVGTWQLQSRSIDGEPYVLNDCDLQSTIVISSSEGLDFNHKVYELNSNSGECTLELDDTGDMSFQYGVEEVPIDGIIRLNYQSRYADGTYAYELSDTTLKLGAVSGERFKTYVKQ